MSTFKLLGAGLAALGGVLIGGLVTVLYSPHPSAPLIWLGIPGALLVSLAGIVALFLGSAIVVRRQQRRRR